MSILIVQAESVKEDQILFMNMFRAKINYPLSDSDKREERSELAKNSTGIGRSTYIITAIAMKHVSMLNQYKVLT